MVPGAEEVLKILDELEPVPTGPVELSAEYLQLVARIEQRAENRDGSDKSWVWELQELDRKHYQQARLVE